MFQRFINTCCRCAASCIQPPEACINGPLKHAQECLNAITVWLCNFFIKQLFSKIQFLLYCKASSQKRKGYCDLRLRRHLDRDINTLVFCHFNIFYIVLYCFINSIVLRPDSRFCWPTFPLLRKCKRVLKCHKCKSHSHTT